jgi:anti-anti-sigma regulatory factor
VASRIHVLELQGELFFGTADRLQAEIEKLGSECRYLILDFRRLHQIDASGARALDVIGHRAERRGFTVCLSHLRVDEPRGRYLRALGLDRVVPTERWFADLDRALEWAEDGLLASEGFERSEATETPFSQMALFHGTHRRGARARSSRTCSASSWATANGMPRGRSGPTVFT